MSMPILAETLDALGLNRVDCPICGRNTVMRRYSDYSEPIVSRHRIARVRPAYGRMRAGEEYSAETCNASGQSIPMLRALAERNPERLVVPPYWRPGTRAWRVGA